MPGFKCENPLEMGRPLDQQMSAEQFLATLREKLNTSGKWKRVTPEVPIPATVIAEPPSAIEEIDMEFDRMQLVVTIAVNERRLTGLEAVQLGKQIERERDKQKNTLLANIAGRDAVRKFKRGIAVQPKAPQVGPKFRRAK